MSDDSDLCSRLRMFLDLGTITRLASTLNHMPLCLDWGDSCFSNVLCNRGRHPARFSVVGTVLSLDTEHHEPPAVTVLLELELFRQKDIDNLRKLHLYANPPRSE